MIRLEPVIMELERQENVLVVGHQVKFFHLLVSRHPHRPVTGHSSMSVRTRLRFLLRYEFPVV